MIQNKTLIARLTLSNYIRQVKLSNKQKEKYYEWNGTTIKCGSKKLLQKYILPYAKNSIINNNGNINPSFLKLNYKIIGFKGNYIYCELHDGMDLHIRDIPNSVKNKPTKYILCEIKKDGLKTYSIIYEKVIANVTQAGKPKMHIIKGQDFYVGLNPFIRNKLVHTLKSSYYDKFKTLSTDQIKSLRNNLNSNYPLIIEMEIQDTVKNCFDNTKKGNGRRWDVGNRAEPYMKTFLDFLVNGYKDKDDNYLLNPLIIDDDRLHISSGNNSYFTPINETDTPKLVFYIYSDNRKVFKNYLKDEHT